MASNKCPACGLVTFIEGAAKCRRCGASLNTSAPAAPKAASGRVVVGPLFTAGGFKSWHLVCLPDALIAVPQGTVQGLLTNAVPSGSGVLYGLAGGLLSAAGQNATAHAADALRQLTEEALRTDPRHVLHRVAALKSITFKKPLLSRPEIRVESSSGDAKVYGVTTPLANEEYFTLLRAAYPTLCRGP